MDVSYSPIYFAIFLVGIFSLHLVEGNTRNKRDTPKSDFKRVCYFINWGIFREGNARFDVDHMDPYLCSHIIYSFANMADNELVPFADHDISAEGSIGMYERFINFKKERNPNLKMMLAVGGYSFGVKNMTSMLESAQNRTHFVYQSIRFLRQHKFDGLELGFSHPGSRGSPPSDKYKYSLLVKELRDAFDSESLGKNMMKLILSASVSGEPNATDNGYEVAKIARDLDFVSIQSYDFHRYWGNRAVHHSPLNPGREHNQYQSKLCMKGAAEYWASQGADKNKIVVGMALFSRGYTLADPSQFGIGATIVGQSDPGPYTKSPSHLTYFEVCEKLRQGAERIWSDEFGVPYMVQGNQWVGYDDVESLSLKAQWAYKEGYGGWAIWSIPEDDFTGRFCAQGKYPLLNALNEAVGMPASSDKPNPWTLLMIMSFILRVFLS